jgi:excisionase family DNA binding protein
VRPGSRENPTPYTCPECGGFYWQKWASALEQRTGSPHETEQLLVSITETARLLDISESKVKELLARHDLHRLKIDGATRISRRELEDYVAQLEAGGRSWQPTAIERDVFGTAKAEAQSSSIRTRTNTLRRSR